MFFLLFFFVKTFQKGLAMLKRMALNILLICIAAFAGKTPFSMVRTVAWDSRGNPSEEVIDLTICLEREPIAEYTDDVNSRKQYENIVKYWADGIYEMSNGGNYLGKIRFFTGGAFSAGCDVVWKKEKVWPVSNIGAFNETGGILKVADIWDEEYPYDHRVGEKNQFDFGMTLTHESMHYIYGLRDEYGQTSFSSDGKGNVVVSADPERNLIGVYVSAHSNYKTYKSWLDVFRQNQRIIFVRNNGILPNGVDLFTNGSNAATHYASIDKVEVQNYDDGAKSVYFSLKDQSGTPVDIIDEGSGNWGVSLPTNASATAHTIQNDQGPLTAFKFATEGSGCYGQSIPWQWANFSTPFNFNRDSKQGAYYKNSAGYSFSGWEIVSSNPVNDVFDKGSTVGGTRFWFKSLKNRKPTEHDVFNAVTHYLNYDENGGHWENGDVTWNIQYRLDEDNPGYLTIDYCSTKSVLLPYMRVELAGKTEEEYSKITRKYLDIQWMSGTKAEIIVVLDHSGSMALYDKMKQAKLASKYVATAFLGSGSGFDASNVRVGVYSFNTSVQQIYAPTYNPNIVDISNAIYSVSPSGRTALLDAVYTAVSAFSNDEPTIKILYVISDGLDNESTRTMQEIVQKYKSKNIAIHTLAYGIDANRPLLAQMASETNGTFYDQQETSVMNVNDATITVLANSVGYEQVAAMNLDESQNSGSIFVPQNAGRVRVYGSYVGPVMQGNPLEIQSSTGLTLPMTIESFPIGNINYFIAEVDSLTISGLNSNAVKVKNNMPSAKMAFRMLVAEKYPKYTMKAEMNPVYYRWPNQGSFRAVIAGNKGVLADVDVVGKMIMPNGSVQIFDLYDDGSHGDVVAGDGLYFGYMPNIESNGTYQWEVSVSNKRRLAHTTRIGTSLPDSMVFDEVVDDTPFEFIRNGQFVVTSCCLDENMSEIQPEIEVNAYLNPNNDIDKFKIVGTLPDKSYQLLIESNEIDKIERIDIFNPQNLMNPIYSVPIEVKQNERIFTMSLSAEYAKPGYIVSVNGKNTIGVFYRLLLLETDFASFAIGRFETQTDWHSSNTTITLDTKHKSEGVRSLVTPAGWKIIESRDVSTADFVMLGDKIDVDLFVPSSTQNQYWIGNVELWLDVPSSNKHIQFGAQQQIQPYFNSWLTYRFDVPEEALSILSEPHSDAHIQIVLNTADSVWVDNMRFAGKLRENTVNKYEPHCPGDEGCTSANPLQLLVNNTIRIVPEGDLWFEVVGFPNDWTPASLHLGVSAEDGAELTGFLSLDDSVVPLSDWYFQRGYTFERNRRYLFKLHNLGGRPYRINAWVDGQVLDVASNTSKSTLPWVVYFY